MPGAGCCFTVRYSGLATDLETDVEVKPADGPSGYAVFKAVWDTGAEISMVRPEVVKALSLPVLGTVLISTPSDTGVPCDVHSVHLRLPNGAEIRDLTVYEGIPSGCDVLIGMDVIGQGDFAVTNHNNVTVFSFRIPSARVIRVVRKLQFPNNFR